MPDRQAGYYWIQRRGQRPEVAEWSTIYSGIGVGCWLLAGVAGWMRHSDGIEVLSGPLVYAPAPSGYCAEDSL